MDAADLAPEHGEHQGDHHRQGQEPGAQPQGVKVRQLGEGRRMDQVGRCWAILLIGRGHGRPFAAIALDGAGMTDGTAFLGFGIGGEEVSYACLIIARRSRHPLDTIRTSLTCHLWS